MTTVPPVRARRKVRRCMEGEKTSRSSGFNADLSGSYAREGTSVTLSTKMGTGAGELLAKIDAGMLGRTLLEAAGAARIGVTVTLVDTPVPRNVYVSEAAADLLGWPVEELLQRDPLQNIASRDLGQARDRLAQRAGGEQGQRTYELLAVRKDGREIALDVTASHATFEGRPAVVAF